VRQRATRTVFTVEVKGRRSKSPHPFTTPESHPREGLRREGLLAAFRHEPPAQPSVDWGDLIKSSHSQESTPSSPETPTAEPTAKIRTGRILPDVLGGQLAAEGIEPQADERAREDLATRRKVNEDARQRQPRAKTPQAAKHISSSEDARIGGISPPPSSEVGRQPRANVRPADRGVTRSTMMPAGSRIEGSEPHRERAKDKRLLSGAQRRAKRRGLPIPLQRSECWKRRLPEVCW
jgi:hypothetical protein